MVDQDVSEIETLALSGFFVVLTEKCGRVRQQSLHKYAVKCGASDVKCVLQLPQLCQITL